jgi:putative hemolysin
MQDLRVHTRFAARNAVGGADMAAVMALRRRHFRVDAGGTPDGCDAACRHLMVIDRGTGALAATCRYRVFPDSGALGTSYAAGFYDLRSLAACKGRFLELSRFCSAGQDADALVTAWGALTRVIDSAGVAVIFGCASFPRADPQGHAPALAALAPHVGPRTLRPDRKAVETLPLGCTGPEAGARAGGLPRLLQTYLAMGGWVSDHAVIDREMDTVHVFTLVEVARVPAARAARLRQLAREIDAAGLGL